MSFLQSLAQANILHFAVGILVKGLVICLLVRVLLSWVLRGQENGVTRFFNNVTAPLVAPFERLIPPISIGGRGFAPRLLPVPRGAVGGGRGVLSSSPPPSVGGS